MSLYTGLRFGQTLAGIAALSGRLPYSKAPETFAPLVHAANKATPLIQLHGEADQVVKFSVGQRSHEVIQMARPDNLTFKAYRVRKTQRYFSRAICRLIRDQPARSDSLRCTEKQLLGSTAAGYLSGSRWCSFAPARLSQAQLLDAGDVVLGPRWHNKPVAC